MRSEHAPCVPRRMRIPGQRSSGVEPGDPAVRLVLPAAGGRIGRLAPLILDQVAEFGDEGGIDCRCTVGNPAARLGGPWRQRCGYSQHPRRKQALPGDTGVLLHLQLGAPVASPLDRTAPVRQQGGPHSRGALGGAWEGLQRLRRRPWGGLAKKPSQRCTAKPDGVAAISPKTEIVTASQPRAMAPPTTGDAVTRPRDGKQGWSAALEVTWWRGATWQISPAARLAACRR